VTVAPGTAGGVTLRRLLASSNLPDVEAKVLARHALGVSRAWLAARLDERIDLVQARAIERLYARRLAGEPVAYITGEREFYSLDIAVAPAVLIPRPETELLVELARQTLAGHGGRVLDLGTGSGAVAIAIAHRAPDAEVWAVDASETALEVARRNVARHQVNVRLVRSDWFSRIAAERFDVIVGNPPYVAAEDPHLARGDLRYEPRGALVSGSDGLDAIRAIAAHAPRHLESGGRLFVEHGWDQAERCRDLLASCGLCDVRSWPDLAGIPRVSGGILD
jgi:release factor glutamine methyltransferase